MKKRKMIGYALLTSIMFMPAIVKADAIPWYAEISSNGNQAKLKLNIGSNTGNLKIKYDKDKLETDTVIIDDSNSGFDDIGHESKCVNKIEDDKNGTITINYTCEKIPDTFEVHYNIKKEFEETKVNVNVESGLTKEANLYLKLYKTNSQSSENCQTQVPCECSKNDEKVSNDNTEEENEVIEENTNVKEEQNIIQEVKEEKKDENQSILTYILIATNIITLIGLVSTLIIAKKKKN